MAYDDKYRRRALEYWADGNSKRKTAEVFKVNPSTLQEWKLRLKETGNLASKKRRQTWRKINPEVLRQHVENHPDEYLRETAAAFNCSINAIDKALKRLRISRKKNHHFSGSE